MSKRPIEIDFSVIEDLTDGDPRVLQDLITTFLRHTNDAIEKVHAALDSADFMQAAQIAHTCIDFTATLGINEPLPALRGVERALKREERDKVARHLANGSADSSTCTGNFRVLSGRGRNWVESRVFARAFARFNQNCSIIRLALVSIGCYLRDLNK